MMTNGSIFDNCNNSNFSIFNGSDSIPDHCSSDNSTVRSISNCKPSASFIFRSQKVLFLVFFFFPCNGVFFFRASRLYRCHCVDLLVGLSVGPMFARIIQPLNNITIYRQSDDDEISFVINDN